MDDFAPRERRSARAAKEYVIAQALRDHVEPGEVWVVRGGYKGVEVSPGEKTSLADSHPELYGRLLQANEAVSSAGGGFVVVGILAVLGACLAVHMQWLDGLIGPDIEKIRSVWVYVFASVAGFLGCGWVATTWEGAVYAQHRHELLAAIDEAGLTPHRVLSEMDGNDSLSSIAERMKHDTTLR